jgi:hypothetical protein
MARRFPGKGMEEVREKNLSFEDVRDYMETVARDAIDWEVTAGSAARRGPQQGFLRARGFLAWESTDESFTVTVRSRKGVHKATLRVTSDEFEDGWLWKLGHIVAIGASMNGWSFSVGDGTGSPDYDG